MVEAAKSVSDVDDTHPEELSDILKKGNRSPKAWLRTLHRNVTIEPEVKDLVIELNKEGFTTTWSCAGHLYGNEHYADLSLACRGVVRFEGLHSPDDFRSVRKILQRRSLKGIHFDKRVVEPVSVRFFGADAVYFKPVGASSTAEHMKLWNLDDMSDDHLYGAWEQCYCMAYPGIRAHLRHAIGWWPIRWLFDETYRYRIKWYQKQEAICRQNVERIVAEAKRRDLECYTEGYINNLPKETIALWVRRFFYGLDCRCHIFYLRLRNYLWSKPLILRLILSRDELEEYKALPVDRFLRHYFLMCRFDKATRKYVQEQAVTDERR